MMSNQKYVVKFLYKLLLSRGFNDPSLIQNWDTLHQQAKNFFPVRLHSISATENILYIKPQNKVSAVTFTYIRTEMLYSLQHLYGYKNITDIQLTK